MRKGTVIAAAVLVIGLATSPAIAQSWTGNINLMLGAKVLDEDDWEPAEEHTGVGILVDFKGDGWPVSIALDLLRSRGDGFVFDPFLGAGVDLRAETIELNAGLRKIWDTRRAVRPFLGGGLALIEAEGRASALGFRVSDSDRGYGYWLNAGVYWTLGGSFNLGLDLRHSRASVSLLDTNVQAGGGHAGIILGYHW